MTDGDARARIVVGVDGSQQSKQALRWAAQLAQLSNAYVHAIAAWQFPVGVGWSVVPSDWDLAAETRDALAKAVDEAFDGDRPAGLRMDVREGYPTQVLLDESRTALMLVVGSRGHGGFAGLLIGSVSVALAEHATCPILIVHGDKNPPLPSA
jgi:nucleotide-binding universal stress UspA family protein